MKDTDQPIVLVILDGFGYQKKPQWNAIAQAKTPFFDYLIKNYPHTLLKASGTKVGLLDGFIGNSEAGHQTIGAGRTIQQPVSVIHEAISNGAVCSNENLISGLKQLHNNKKNLHIIGLLSDTGVHSHQELLYTLMHCALKRNIPHVYLHLILDGRDTPPQSAKRYLEPLEQFVQKHPSISIASLHGRFYAMDRDHNFDRTKKSFEVLTQTNRPQFNDWQSTLSHWYSQNTTDEFMPPTSLDNQGHIKPGDGIIFFNFRPDRARQLTGIILEHQKQLHVSFFITPFSYDKNLKTIALFERPSIKNTLYDVLSSNNKTVFAIAETEKYAHVTYFFTSGREKPLTTETWKLIPSIKTKNYALTPEMSASKITHEALNSLQHNPKDFYLINYANADMVGHTGDFEATKQAVECLDKQLRTLWQQVINNMNGTLIITADHGNAEQMYDPTTKQPKTAHTTNKVPFLVINKQLKGKDADLPLDSIADIAPYILNYMHLPNTPEMNNPME